MLQNRKETLGAHLAGLFISCLEIGCYPRAFKEPTTVVLRNPQKPRYDVPKAYRPIALLNTLGKALEKIVASRLSRMAEDNNLPQGQTGARPQRSTLSALELVTGQGSGEWTTWCHVCH